MTNSSLTMTPETRARYDYREEGAGQDHNPYDREIQRDQYNQYAWEMHKIWSEEFTAEQQLSRSINQQETSKDVRDQIS